MISHGPAMNVRGPEKIEDVPLSDRVSFRLIGHYQPNTDTTILRLDIKRGTEQWNAAMAVSWAQPQPGQSFNDPNRPLVLPAKGVEQCAGGVVDRETLRQALLALAEKLA